MNMGVSASSISRVTGVDVAYKNFNTGKTQLLPQRLAVIGQGNTGMVFPEVKYEGEGSAALVAERYGYGYPLHLAAMQLYPTTGKGASFPVTFYPLKDATNAVAATGSIGVTGTATAAGSGRVYIGGMIAEFAVAKGAAAATILESVKNAISGVLEMPVIAGEVLSGELTLTAKWKGTGGNLVNVSLEANIDGLVFNTTEMKNGAIDPDVSPVLEKIGDVWETVILSCFDFSASERLDTYQSWGEERWGANCKRPVLVAHGCSDGYAVRTEITDERKNDYINFLVQSTGSRELPWVIAAKGLVCDVMTTADSNPACGYKGLLNGLHTGPDFMQENYYVRNNAIGKGSSTNIKNGNVAQLNDVITFYHPAAEGKYPSRRYVVDLMKLMNVVYNVRLIMEADDMVGVPLVSDETVTTNEKAVQPKTVKAMFFNLADSLAKAAIIQEEKFTKKNMSVAIDGENPKRLNVKFPVKLSGNIEISSTDVYFGFYLGGE